MQRNECSKVVLLARIHVIETTRYFELDIFTIAREFDRELLTEASVVGEIAEP
jgi:hypothetical protein